MARILIFCGTRAAIERYDMAGVPIMVYQYKTKFEEILKTFAADPNGQLAMDAQGGAFGFHVPSDTFVVFDASWPYGADHPITIQAKGRASRADAIGLQSVAPAERKTDLAANDARAGDGEPGYVINYDAAGIVKYRRGKPHPAAEIRFYYHRTRGFTATVTEGEYTIYRHKEYAEVRAKELYHAATVITSQEAHDMREAARAVERHVQSM